jgi:hypothetical protein
VTTPSIFPYADLSSKTGQDTPQSASNAILTASGIVSDPMDVDPASTSTSTPRKRALSDASKLEGDLPAEKKQKTE